MKVGRQRRAARGRSSAMMTTDPLAFASYVNDLTYTIFYFLQKPQRPEALIEWLRPMASDEDSRAQLMHEEPLYVAADFLGIDRFSPSFGEIEENYQQFRTTLLYPSRQRLIVDLAVRLGPSRINRIELNRSRSSGTQRRGWPEKRGNSGINGATARWRGL